MIFTVKYIYSNCCNFLSHKTKHLKCKNDTSHQQRNVYELESLCYQKFKLGVIIAIRNLSKVGYLLRGCHSKVVIF